MSHDLPNDIICICAGMKRSLGAILKLEMARLEHTEKKVEEITKQISAANAVDFIYHGVAIQALSTSVRRGDGHFYAVSSEIRRYACVYRNATNPRRWGLRIDKFSQPGKPDFDSGGRCMGAGWKTKKAAKEAALRWIALGEMPEERWR